jgi:hypothetical protein
MAKAYPALTASAVSTLDKPLHGQQNLIFTGFQSKLFKFIPYLMSQ